MVKLIVLNNIALDSEAERGTDGEYLINSQRGWEQHFADTGKRLPTIGELISGIQQLDQRNDPALQGILQDMRESALCAGKLNYDKSNLPVGDGYLDVLVKDSAWRQGLEYELFQYDAPETVDMLQRVSGERPYILTPSVERRKSHPERAVWLYILTDRFYLNCGNNPIGSNGRARGVRGGASVSEQEAPLVATAEIKLLQAPANITSQNNLERSIQNIYDPTELAYATGLLNGSSGGTVLDWKNRPHSK